MLLCVYTLPAQQCACSTLLLPPPPPPPSKGPAGPPCPVALLPGPARHQTAASRTRSRSAPSLLRRAVHRLCSTLCTPPSHDELRGASDCRGCTTLTPHQHLQGSGRWGVQTLVPCVCGTCAIANTHVAALQIAAAPALLGWLGCRQRTQHSIAPGRTHQPLHWTGPRGGTPLHTTSTQQQSLQVHAATHARPKRTTYPVCTPPSCSVQAACWAAGDCLRCAAADGAGGHIKCRNSSTHNASTGTDPVRRLPNCTTQLGEAWLRNRPEIGCQTLLNQSISVTPVTIPGSRPFESHQ